jgi:hypothetical protein
MRHLDAAERRRRLLVRHHLAAPAAAVEQVAGDVVGLHSSDPATVVLAARARLDPFTVADLEDALYERRALLRMLAMRRTMFVVPLDLAAVLQASCTNALVPGERRKLLAMLHEAGVAQDVDAWIARLEAETMEALAEHGPLAANQLTKLIPDLALQFKVAVGKRYEGTIGVSTRLLFLMSTQGLIARTRPLGSWISSQYRWARMLDDLAWWTKWTKADVRAALRANHAVEVTVDVDDDGSPAAAWVLPDDLDDTPDPGSTVNLLPALDPTIMGWRDRGWYLGPHRAPLFDRNGNAGPTVWVDGRAVGAWSQRAGGEVVTALLEPVGSTAARRVAAAAAGLTTRMDGVRVTPRFPTPLDRQLATS